MCLQYEFVVFYAQFWYNEIVYHHQEAAMRAGNVSTRKLSYFAIVINSVQIAAALFIAVMFVCGGFSLSPRFEKALVIFAALVVIWGAVLDIRDAVNARRMEEQREMLESAYAQLESLNTTLRKQRHDFLNHIQVIYSLTELYDRNDALAYMDEVYPEIQKTGQALKTKSAAVNALLAGKIAECESKHIEFTTEITTDMANLPTGDWEFCRVLGNLIDNAIDAAGSSGKIKLSMSEDVKYYRFSVENTGERIPKEIAARIFETGFSTKGEDRGMGLAIARELLEKHGGELNYDSGAENTTFTGSILKKTEQG